MFFQALIHFVKFLGEKLFLVFTRKKLFPFSQKMFWNKPRTYSVQTFDIMTL